MAPIRGWKTVGTPYEPRSRRRESARLFAFQAKGLAPTHVGGYGFRGSTRESFQEISPSRRERPELCARLAPLNQPTAPSPRPSPPPRGRGCPKGGRGGGHGQGTAAARRVFWAHWIGKLRRGHSPNPAEDSPSVQGRVALLAIAHRTTRASRSQKSCVNTQDRPLYSLIQRQGTLFFSFCLLLCASVSKPRDSNAAEPAALDPCSQ